MRKAILRLCTRIDSINFLGACLAAASCVLLAAILIVEVIVTSRFSWSQPWAVEYSAYLCALALFAGSGYAVRQGSHIRVRIILSLLPQTVARVLEIFCTLAALAVTAILTYGMIELALRSFERSSRSYFVMQTPLYIPQSLLAVSAILLFLALLSRLLRLLINDAPDLATTQLSDPDAHK